ncbi:hypothetical protein A9Q86_08895 [Flavobacteriales bacterium 33_180_T64]|nr:hypothetical protein A9Q86_08895 [Flavobacteriales bacterium 33_180_T64]
MGLGMASWIYKQRPRKPFSKRKSKPTCNTLPSYNRTFKLQPSKKSNDLYIIISVLLLGLLFFSLSFKIPQFIDYSNTLNAKKQERIERNNTAAFQFLMNSGLSRLRGNNYIGAYSEFKLAHDIYPNNEFLNQLIIETLSALCENDNAYCDDLEFKLKNTL